VVRSKGFNRVELIVPEDQIGEAVRQFNELLGTNLPEPHPIAGHPVLSATDFDGQIELVAPVNGEGHFGRRLEEHGMGQIGPLVWEVDDIDEARASLSARDLKILFEYDSSQGVPEEQRLGVRQLVLDPAQWFGFNVTLMQRGESAPE
jgi:hypothetical protein